MKPSIIIGGCPGSGTTLLRSILDSHPNLHAGPELAMTMVAADAAINSWSRIGERASTLYDLEDGDFALAYGKAIKYIHSKIRDRVGKDKRIVDKMPQSIQHFSTLCWMLPESYFIHIIRDGRDVACSLLDRDDMFHDDTGEIMEFCKDAKKGVEYWAWIVQQGMRIAHPKHPAHNRYYQIRYEDLVRNPKEELSKLLDFIDEPWSDEVLKHHKKNHNLETYISKEGNRLEDKPITDQSVGRWKEDLTPKQKFEVHKIAGQMLDVLNYDIPDKIKKEQKAVQQVMQKSKEAKEEEKNE